jgi:hypothetical protein
MTESVTAGAELPAKGTSLTPDTWPVGMNPLTSPSLAALGQNRVSARNRRGPVSRYRSHYLSRLAKTV